MTRINDPCPDMARTRDTRFRAVSIAAVFGLVAATVLVGQPAARAATQVELGTAGSFAVLADTTITNRNATTITGDVGLHPGKAVTGFDDVTLHGQLHVADAVASKAKDDLVLAYDSAVGQGDVTTVPTELGGQRLPGGVYDSADGTFEITANPLVLDAEGTPSTVWIFQTESTLITASNSSVTLVNGADACNVFWQVGSSATLGTGTSFAGTILALTSISLTTSATIHGRALARNGAVTMDNNTITQGNCTSGDDSSPDPSPSPSPSPSPTPSPSPSSSPGSSSSPSEVAGPVDSTAGTPDASGGTPAAPGGTPAAPGGTPVAAGGPDVPVTAAPPTSGTPQVPTVPTGSVGAGDGSTAIDEQPGHATAALGLLPLLAAVALYATWRRREA